MRIVADQHIPFIADIFSGIGDLHLIPGHQITAKTIKNADALVVRTITKIDHSLLQNSRVSFVGSATAGVDHVDQDYLRGRNIAFEHAPGANAISVVEYVLACLAEFSLQNGVDFENKTIGIVGVGHVGGTLAKRCRDLGMNVLLNDPPRQEKEVDTSQFVSLDHVLEQADILSIHTPLTSNGKFPTVRLIGAAETAAMRPGCWFIHTARGGVCDESALIEARKKGGIGALSLDVWENEPTPNHDSIHGADISTGHIAGYSIDAKIAGVRMIRDQLVRHLRRGLHGEGMGFLAENQPVSIPTTQFNEPMPRRLSTFIQSLYPVRLDDNRFRREMTDAHDQAESFHSYRATYPIRRSFSTFGLPGQAPASWVKGLGLSV